MVELGNLGLYNRRLDRVYILLDIPDMLFVFLKIHLWPLANICYGEGDVFAPTIKISFVCVSVAKIVLLKT